jgi:hypothetical protein
MSRMVTRSMTRDLPKKRFHEDPYPPTKRRRVKRDEPSDCMIFILFICTIVNGITCVIYCYYYYEIIQPDQSIA